MKFFVALADDPAMTLSGMSFHAKTLTATKFSSAYGNPPVKNRACCVGLDPTTCEELAANASGSTVGLLSFTVHIAWRSTATSAGDPTRESVPGLTPPRVQGV